MDYATFLAHLQLVKCVCARVAACTVDHVGSHGPNVSPSKKQKVRLSLVSITLCIPYSRKFSRGKIFASAFNILYSGKYTVQREILNWCRLYKNKNYKSFCIQNFNASNVEQAVYVDRAMALYWYMYFLPLGALPGPMDPCPHMLALQRLKTTTEL